MVYFRMFLQGRLRVSRTGLLVLLLAVPFVVSATDRWPGGTEIATDFQCSAKNVAEHLIDGAPNTLIGGDPNTARDPAHVFLAFPEPIRALAGVETGPADPNHNYYANKLEFWADTTGDETFDTFCGSVVGLGGGPKGRGRHVFAETATTVHALLMRVVEQNRAGLNRSFFMAELSPILDAGSENPTTGPALLAETPPPLRRNPEPIVVETMGAAVVVKAQGSSYGVVNGRRNEHSGTVVDTAEGRVFRLDWKQGGKRFAELTFGRNAPFVLAFRRGVRIEVDVDKGGFPNLTTWGIRCRDARGETWHFGAPDMPAGKEKVTATLVLDPASTRTNSYGGPAEGRGEIDLPLQFSTLMFNAPADIEEERSILIGEMRRNEVAPRAVEPEIALMGIKAGVVTTGPLNLIPVDRKAEAAVTLTLADGREPMTVALEIVCTPYNGEGVTVQHDDVALTPGATVRATFADRLDRLGWWRVEPVVLTADGKGRVAKKAIQVALIQAVEPRAKPPVDGFWFGLDARLHKNDYKELAEAAAMIGADIVREGVTWSKVEEQQGQPNWAEHDTYLHELNNRGIYGQYGFSFSPAWTVSQEHRDRIKHENAPGWKTAMCPPDPEAWRTYVKTAMQHIRNEGLNVQFFEIWNEPDLYGFWRGTTDQYLEILRIASEEIRTADPNYRVMTGGIATVSGHGGHSRNPDLIRRTVVGMQDHYDIVNIHEHCWFNRFHPKIDGGWADLREQLKQDKPLYFNETGAASEDRRRQAHELVKKFVYARDRGAIGFNWFCLNFGSEHGYSMTTNDLQPYPTVPTYSAMVNRMRGQRPAGQIDVGRGNWMFALSSDDETLLVGWDEESPSPTRVPVVVPQDSDTAFYDIMGNAEPATVEHGVCMWTLTKDVRYLVVRDGTPRVAPPLAVFGDEPYGEPGKHVEIDATVANPLSVGATVNLTWTGHDGGESRQTLTLKPGTSERVVLGQTMPATRGQDRAEVGLTYTFAETGWSGTMSLPMHASRVIPGAGIEERKPDFVIEDESHVFNANKADPTRAQWTWKGRDDISAKVWLAAEDEALLLQVDVRDERHMQPNDAQSSWKADGVQFGLLIPGRDGSWELGLALSDTGKPMTACWKVPVGLDRSYAGTIDLQVSRLPGGMSYRARLPYAGLGVDRAFLRMRAIGFNLIVNDEDGGGREGWVFAAPGMGMRSEPRQWPLLTFE